MKHNGLYLLKYITITVIVALIFDVMKEWHKLKDYNQSPLCISTFDGSNSPYHPSVKYFENGWNNYKFWMAETPFYPASKPYRDRFECPSIHVSNDGLHWTEIIRNPLDDLDSIGIKEFDYYSDPHLIFNNDTLECWYRINKRYGNIEDKRNVFLLCRKTSDGVHWTSRDTLFNFHAVQEEEMVSPSILRSDSTYEMWYVDNYKVYFNESANPKQWNKGKICTLNGHNCVPWHLDVVNEDGYYWLLIYDMVHDELTLWKAKDRRNFEFIKVILTHSSAVGSFYQTMLYRSCLLKQNDTCYKCYFSASNEENTFLGLMEGTSFENMQIISIDNVNYSDFSQFLTYYILTRWRPIKFRIKHHFNLR